MIRKVPRVYFDNLDALRFLCFLLVFLYHSFYTELDFLKENSIYRAVQELFKNGMIGVNFFFVLSGFLITYLLIIEKIENGKINILSFYYRRILRIWPLYFFCVIFGFVLFPYIKILFGETPNETANPVSFLLFFNNFDLINNGLPDCSTLGILWSIAIEEQFYIVWPIIIAFIPLKYLKYLFAAIIGGSYVFRAVMNDINISDFHTFSCIGDMAIGGLASYLIIQSIYFKSAIYELKKAYILLIYLSVAFIYFFRDELVLIDYLKHFERLITALIFVFVILEQTFSKKSFFKIGKVQILTWLGKMTYGLYMLQMIAILITLKSTHFLGINEYLIVVLLFETLIAFLLNVFFAWFSFQFFEGWFLRMKGKFL